MLIILFSCQDLSTSPLSQGSRLMPLMHSSGCVWWLCVCVCVCVCERERESVCHYRALRQRVRIDYKKDCWKIIHHLTHLCANKSQKQRETLMFIFIHVIYLLSILLSLIIVCYFLIYYFIILFGYIVILLYLNCLQLSNKHFCNKMRFICQ